MYQLILEPISRLNIDTSVYAIVAQCISAVENVPFIFNLVAKPHIIAHVKLYELEYIARKIPQLYAYREICTGDMCSNGYDYYALLDLVRILEPPSNCGGMHDFRYVDFIDGTRVYWDAFVLEDVEEMNASNCISHSVDGNSSSSSRSFVC
jgi:hypothetical protein